MFFGAGGELGFDTLAAQTVLQLKKDYQHIRLILVLPCVTQTSGWDDVDNSSACVCYLTENKGGTYYTVNYARQNNLKISKIAEEKDDKTD